MTAPRFVGTVGAKFSELTKALGKLGKPQSLRSCTRPGRADLPWRGAAAGGLPLRGGGALEDPASARGSGQDRSARCAHPGRPARAGELGLVSVPDERDEAMRDLSRARIDAVRARLKARQQLKALLLRHGRRYSGKTSWTAAHERYLATVSFAHRPRTSPSPSTVRRSARRRRESSA